MLKGSLKLRCFDQENLNFFAVTGLLCLFQYRDVSSLDFLYFITVPEHAVESLHFVCLTT